MSAGGNFGLAYNILKKGVYDKELLDAFWSLYASALLEEDAKTSRNNADVNCICDEDIENEDADDEASLAGQCGMSGPPNVSRMGSRYAYLRKGWDTSYRHRYFESVAARRILRTLGEYEQGKCCITAGNYAQAVAFLVAVEAWNLPLKHELIRQLRVPSLVVLSNAVALSRRSNHDVAGALNEQSRRLLEIPLTASEYIGLADVNMLYQKNRHLPKPLVDSMRKTFEECLTKAVEAPWCDGRTAAAILCTMSSSKYNVPGGLEKIAYFVYQADEDISVKVAAKFAKACFLFGARHREALSIAARVIERSLERLHPLTAVDALLGLCYHELLSKDLVYKVVTDAYLHEIDEQIRITPRSSGSTLKLQNLVMELNRAVCIDMPEAEVPWFHEKYCQQMAAVAGTPAWTALHYQVRKTLNETFGPACVAQNVYTRYNYVIDFLVRFDNEGRPVPRLVALEDEDAQTLGKERIGEELAVLVHRPEDYTWGVRQLKGEQILKIRHLETLGYRVIEINPLEWDAVKLMQTIVAK